MARDPLEVGMKTITMFLFVALLFGCHDSPPRGVPQELLGRWGTSDSDYQGCTFEITGRMIIFENDRDFIAVNWIKGTEKLTQGEKVLYRIHYEDREDLAFTAFLSYSKTEEGEVLKFANLNQVEWKRIGETTMRGAGL